MLRCLVASKSLGCFDSEEIRSAWRCRRQKPCSWWWTRFKFGIRIVTMGIGPEKPLTIVAKEPEFERWRRRHA